MRLSKAARVMHCLRAGESHWAYQVTLSRHIPTNPSIGELKLILHEHVPMSQFKFQVNDDMRERILKDTGGKGYVQYPITLLCRNLEGKVLLIHDGAHLNVMVTESPTDGVNFGFWTELANGDEQILNTTDEPLYAFSHMEAEDEILLLTASEPGVQPGWQVDFGQDRFFSTIQPDNTVTWRDSPKIEAQTKMAQVLSDPDAFADFMRGLD